MVPLNTSGHRGGHQFIAVNPKLELRRCTHILFQFLSKRFINYIIIIKSCQTYPAHIVMCYNAKTGVTETLLTTIFEPKTAHSTSARHVLSYVITTTRAQFKSKSNVFFFFLILWLFDFSAILLLLAFASSSCLLYKFISKHMRN